MRATLLAGSLILTLFATALTGCIIDGGRNEVEVINNSSFFIEVIRVRDSTSNFGRNRLPAPLPPRGRFRLIDLYCDTYDLQVQDELGATCNLVGVDVCFGGRAVLPITDDLLVRCPFRRR